MAHAASNVPLSITHWKTALWDCISQTYAPPNSFAILWERQAMRLLLQLKDGPTSQRRLALRSLTSRAPDFGAALLFRNFC
jgi:hypothetical protein